MNIFYRGGVALGLRSRPPVVWSFSHFVTGCCANGFYDPGPFSSAPPLSSTTAHHYLALLCCLGGEQSAFLSLFYH